LSFFGFFGSLWLRNCPLAIIRLLKVRATADSRSILDRKNPS
jgi:plasmid stability protein